ncbi:uncharacterized protein E0L32_003231 [Thyridium curvatum]|uniref:Pentatricopeptide repeat-containing protein n=1 Tax=Thyridium curvatum TaxID=1093900 RepID=A0A507BC65_9PEZI|nr:uncharacterized protein E0L32_003231 [Thyridium curvatum]TPX17113.1 hypothetical protein E0L32_003231 [Thyridium curvatum]
MKSSSRIDGSICGAILSSRPSSRWPAPGFFQNRRLCGRCSIEARSQRRHYESNTVPRTASTPPSNNLIPQLPPRSLLSVSRTTPESPAAHQKNQRRFGHAVATPVASDTFWQQARPSPSKKELLSYVDQYDDQDSVDEHLEFFRDPYRRGYAPDNGPEVTVSNREEDVRFPSRDETKPADEREHKILRELRSAVLKRLRNPLRASADEVYNLYRQLPEPRMPYLSGALRHQLLRAIGVTEKKDSKSMLRYFAVIADVKNSGFPLLRAEWNTAMSYASRYVGVSTDSETESALSLWREMEQDAGIKGNDVTFNIMFDVASKAGNFTLAEMIYKEMENRGHRFNRYHHVSLIHFFGLKMDGDGVRAAYKEMVESGEMIDSLVLNCVIAGLLRSGEEDAAARVYERMKASHKKAPEMPERNYATQKVVTRVLMMFAKVGKEHPEMRNSFQALTPMTPNLSTFRILIYHYAVKLGDLESVAKYLDEMKFFEVPLHGAVFLSLFKGFNAHGGYDGSAWSEQRLQSVWTALLQALDNQTSGLYIDTWLVIWALRAFDRCSSPEAVLEAYDALSSRWELEPADIEFLMGFLHNLLKKRQGGVTLLEDSLDIRSSGRGKTTAAKEWGGIDNA